MLTRDNNNSSNNNDDKNNNDSKCKYINIVTMIIIKILLNGKSKKSYACL